MSDPVSPPTRPARDQWRVAHHLTDSAEKRYNEMADEIDRLRAAVVAEAARITAEQPGPEVRRLIMAAEFWVRCKDEGIPTGDAENAIRGGVRAVQAVGLTQHPEWAAGRPVPAPLESSPYDRSHDQ